VREEGLGGGRGGLIIALVSSTTFVGSSKYSLFSIGLGPCIAGSEDRRRIIRVTGVAGLEITRLLLAIQYDETGVYDIRPTLQAVPNHPHQSTPRYMSKFVLRELALRCRQSPMLLGGAEPH
jgi:hypothetical protein